MRLQLSPLPYVVAGLMLLLDATLATPLGAQVQPMAGAAPDAKAITINAPPAPPARSAQQGTSPLERVVSLDLRKVSLRSALDEIGRQSGVALTYSPRVVPVERVVSVRGEKITVAKALATVLRGTGVEVEVTAGGGKVVVKANGAGDVLSIKISKEVVDPEDVEMLEDLVLTGVQKAIEEGRALMQAEMSKITGGLGLPPGMGF